MKKSLLDDLTEHIGCLYLSDLKGLVGSAKFITCIKEIPQGAYPLSAWNECIYYLTAERKDFATEQEAREFLLKPQSL